MWKPKELSFVMESPSKIVAVAAGHLAGYALDGTQAALSALRFAKDTADLSLTQFCFRSCRSGSCVFVGHPAIQTAWL